jgi:excinuclease UvrABC ATPase subunit
MEKPTSSHRGIVARHFDRAKTAGHNPRSTVGTVTEIYDYLRLAARAPEHLTAPTAVAPFSAEPVQIAERFRGRATRASRFAHRWSKDEKASFAICSSPCASRASFAHMSTVS